MPCLTTQQVQHYQQNGYIIIDTGIEHKILDQIIEDLHDVWGNKDITSLPVIHDNRIQDGWKINDHIHELSTHKPILEVLKELYQKQARPFQTLNFRRGTEQSVHSDSIHFNSEPFGMMCGVWIALEDIGPDQGPLVYYPGSNLWPEQNFPDMGLKAGDFKGYQKYLNAQIAESQIEPAYGLLKKGEALIWAANLLHGGSRQHDKTLTRYSQVTHYYFEGGKYWRPTLSQDSRRYFTPDWMPLSLNPPENTDKEGKTSLLQRLSQLFSGKS